MVNAAGLAGFALLAPLLGPVPGRGVKGQAALLDATPPKGAPMIFADGIYIVPHGPRRVAVGSTSETVWTAPEATDEALDAVIAAAARMCPPLRSAQVRARWAALRPRAPRPDPMLGPLPGHPRILAALGGFKIGFGLVPGVAAALSATLAGERHALPDMFSVAHHLDGRS